ncbi:MAG: glycosyltransferase family 39 protein [Actinomycetota bacterium]|nr:glycosyltransferase family 39 protein [Actinomycetota bacterium]
MRIREAGGLVRSGAVLVLAVVALVGMLRLPSFVHQLFDPDEAALAAQGISVRDGGTLYVDATDRKPPLVPFLYAGSFAATGSTDLRPVHVLAALALVGAALVVASEARRRDGPEAGWWAAGLCAAGALAFFPVDAQAANFAHFAILPGAAAIVASRRGRWSTALAGGVFLGVAVLCRQSWIIGVVPAMVGAALAGRVRHALVTLAGLAAAIGAVAFVVPFGRFWHWTFSANGGFVLAGAPLGKTAGAFAVTVLTFVALHVTLVALVAMSARRRIGDRLAWRSDIDLWLWVLTGCVSVVAGFRFFGHYWLQVVPPACLLAAPLAVRLQPRLRRLAVAGVALPTIAAFAAAWTPSTFRHLQSPRRLASYADAHTRAGRPVMVWGTFPEVYWAADRPPGGALVHDDFVTGKSGGRPSSPKTIADATPGAYEDLLHQLRRRPPDLILDTSTADLRGYGAYPIRLFGTLRRFVDRHYRRAAVVDRVVIYRRR